jgi:hypothetical protein
MPSKQHRIISTIYIQIQWSYKITTLNIKSFTNNCRFLTCYFYSFINKFIMTLFYWSVQTVFLYKTGRCLSMSKSNVYLGNWYHFWVHCCRPEWLITKHLNENRALLYNNTRRINIYFHSNTSRKNIIIIIKLDFMFGGSICFRLRVSNRKVL